LLPAGIGAVGLWLVMAMLPIFGERDLTGQILSSALVLLPVGTLLYGLLAFAADLAVSKLLFLGVAAGTLSVAAAYFGGRPEELTGGPAAWPLTLLFLADAFRIVTASCAGLVLARPFSSAGAALLTAGAAAVADLFSVFAGPTKALVEREAPSLDYLLLWFPTLGRPLGFSLGVSDFVFLALFAAMAKHLNLRPLATLVLGCVAVVLALLAALFLARPLPALPFIALSFVLANAAPLVRLLLAKE
jgi:hypothetical protein